MYVNSGSAIFTSCTLSGNSAVSIDAERCLCSIVVFMIVLLRCWITFMCDRLCSDIDYFF